MTGGAFGDAFHLLVRLPGSQHHLWRAVVGSTGFIHYALPKRILVVALLSSGRLFPFKFDIHY
jgi:hypothetical protein